MKKLQSIWVIKDGKVKVIKEKEFRDALATLPDGRYWNVLERAYNRRSTLQNNSVFGICYKILQECFIDSFGHYVSIEWTHEFAKNPENNIIPEEYVERIKNEWNEDSKNKLVNQTTGEVTIIPFVCTTTKMRTVEMAEYYNNMQDFAWNYFNTEIPEPDADWKDKINENDTTSKTSQ